MSRHSKKNKVTAGVITKIDPALSSQRSDSKPLLLGGQKPQQTGGFLPCVAVASKNDLLQNFTTLIACVRHC